MGKAILTIGMVLATAIAGASAGMIVGAAAGFAYVEIAGTASSEDANWLMALGFGPVGAVIGAVVLPVVYLVLWSQAKHPSPIDTDADVTDEEWPG